MKGERNDMIRDNTEALREFCKAAGFEVDEELIDELGKSHVCGTCRFWKSPYWRRSDTSTGWIAYPHQLGECVHTVIAHKLGGWSVEDDAPLYYASGEYNGVMITSNNFGCVCWEKKAKNPFPNTLYVCNIEAVDSFKLRCSVGKCTEHTDANDVIDYLASLQRVYGFTSIVISGIPPPGSGDIWNYIIRVCRDRGLPIE